MLEAKAGEIEDLEKKESRTPPRARRRFWPRPICGRSNAHGTGQTSTSLRANFATLGVRDNACPADQLCQATAAGV